MPTSSSISFLFPGAAPEWGKADVRFGWLAGYCCCERDPVVGDLEEVVVEDGEEKSLVQRGRVVSVPGTNPAL